MEGLYRKVLSSCRVTSNPKRFLGEAVNQSESIISLHYERFERLGKRKGFNVVHANILTNDETTHVLQRQHFGETRYDFR